MEILKYVFSVEILGPQGLGEKAVVKMQSAVKQISQVGR